MKCYCDFTKTYTQCCEPFHSGAAQPNTAEKLMRSRYSAFCLQHIDYIISTCHPDYRENNSKQSLEQSVNNTQWLRLKILKGQEKGKEKDQSEISAQYQVEFCAFYTTGGSVKQHHELSNFVYQDNRWFYTDGILLGDIKIGRNETCICGSEKKFKRCCSTETPYEQ